MRQETVVSGLSVRDIARGGLVGGVMAVTLALAGPALGAAPAPKLDALQILEGTVGVPESVALSPNGKTMYVSGGETFGTPGPVYVVNLADLSATPAEISASVGGSALTEAGSIALSPNGKQLYIANLSTGAPVEIADVGGSGATNNAVVGSISAGSSTVTNVASLAVAPNGKTVYMSASGSSGSEFPAGGADIDAAAMTSPTAGTVTSSDTSGSLGDVTGLAVSSSGKLLYAANWIGPATVSKLSGAAISGPHALPQVFSAYDIAVSPDGHTLYGDVSSLLNLLVAGESSTTPPASSEIDTFALAGGGMTASMANSSLLGAGDFPLGIALSSTGTDGYATELDPSSSTPTVGIYRFSIAAAATKVTVAGSAKAGGSLTAKLKATSGANSSYAWMANGKAIKGATKSKLKITKSLVGKKLTVKVTVTAVGYHEATVISKAVTVK
jgi:hypothetical protein